jgi:lipopolysaccharide export system protein LptA
MSVRCVARVGALLAMFAVAAAARSATAQQTPSAREVRKPCSLVFTEVKLRDTVTHYQLFKTGTGQYNSFISGVDAVCAGSDQRILSDSAENYGDEKRLLLIGNVHYSEARVKLDADRMTYFTAEERIVAEGNVVGVTNTGTHFTGPRAEYWRPAPGVRDKSRLDATSRPDMWVSSTDAGGGGSTDSVHIQADRVITENDSLVYAKGKVIIDRPDIIATSDSAFMDNGKEFVRLTGEPVVTGRGERKFVLSGEIIDTYSKQRQVSRVRSSGNAKALSDDITLTADSIDLRVSNQKLDRAYAWGPKRAKAHSPDRDITADSIDIVMPGQSVREMRALRNARAETQPDTSKIIASEPDWLRGDTLVAHFDTVATGDTINKPGVKNIVATGSAKSYYQVAPGGMPGKTKTPNINYVTGKTITVLFVDKQVKTVNVTGKAEGFYVEAAPDSSSVMTKSDSTATKTDPKKATKTPTKAPVPAPAKPPVTGTKP